MPYPEQSLLSFSVAPFSLFEPLPVHSEQDRHKYHPIPGRNQRRVLRPAKPRALFF
jgi:hypothetical protein